MGHKSDTLWPAEASGPDHTLFISYRVSDTGPTASRLSEELVEAYGREHVFLDHERLEGGVVWPDQLEAEARRAAVMLVLIGEGWLRAHDPQTGMRRLDQAGDWVRKEIEAALGSAGTLVVPLLVEGAEPLGKEAFATVPSLAPLANRQPLRLRQKDWRSDLERLHELLAANGFMRRRTSITGVSPEQLEELVRDRTKPLQELADAQKRLISRLEGELELNKHQVHAALEAASEAEVPPEQLAAKLGEIAGRYKTLREEVRPALGDNPRIAALKAQANEAVEEGDLERADKLIGGPDIFLSYAREDRVRVAPMAEALEARGWSVFWDQRIPAGKTWRSHIGRALEKARCVVVAWSEHSIQSDWVIEEADEGKKRGILVPAFLDAVLLPWGFRGIQSADLSGWLPERPSPAFDSFLADLGAVLGVPQQEPPPSGALLGAPHPGPSPPSPPAGVLRRLTLAGLERMTKLLALPGHLGPAWTSRGARRFCYWLLSVLTGGTILLWILNTEPNLEILQVAEQQVRDLLAKEKSP